MLLNFQVSLCKNPLLGPLSRFLKTPNPRHRFTAQRRRALGTRGQQDRRFHVLEADRFEVASAITAGLRVETAALVSANHPAQVAMQFVHLQGQGLKKDMDKTWGRMSDEVCGG